MTSIASSQRFPRSSLETPHASYSRGSSWPRPTAGRKRPLEKWSRVAISLARTTGLRRGSWVTAVPNFIFSE